MDLISAANPLLAKQDAKTVDLTDLASPLLLNRPKRSAKRELLDVRRSKTAADAIVALTKENELYGFTKGQFSVLDLIVACLKRTGPAHFTISTWTAARKEIVEIDGLVKSGAITGARWLVDYAFVRRDRQASHQIRQTFGHDSIRIASTHSKFCMFQNTAWQLVLRSSMNLNMNPRFEDFTLANDPELAAFLNGILDEIWTKQKKDILDAERPRGAECREFRDEM